LEHHAKKIRERVRELTQKSYWKQFEHSPDFVVMFIPGDQFLTAALDRDPALIEEAIQNKVIIATPMTLVALLRAVAYGWRQESIAANAEEIKELGQQLYDRFAVFMDHLAGVGKHLNRSVDQYNKTLGSLDHKLMPTLRRFETLGIHGKSRPESIDPIDQLARTASSEDEHEKR
jgi:DNA recombination protein RmuC